MTIPTTADGPAVDNRIVDRAEQTLRGHAHRTEQQLRELESDMDGLLHDEAIQEDRDGERRLIESVRFDLLRVQRALQRIQSGTYGQCTRCGEAIAAERLTAIPESECEIAHGVSRLSSDRCKQSILLLLPQRDVLVRVKTPPSIVRNGRRP